MRIDLLVRGRRVVAQDLGAPGMADTSFPTTPEMPDPHARGCLEDPKTGQIRDVIRSNPDVPLTAGAMTSTLEDLKTWAKAVATDASFRYGLGLFEVLGFVGHDGGILGHSTFMAHRPEDGAP